MKLSKLLEYPKEARDLQKELIMAKSMKDSYKMHLKAIEILKKQNVLEIGKQIQRTSLSGQYIVLLLLNKSRVMFTNQLENCDIQKTKRDIIHDIKDQFYFLNFLYKSDRVIFSCQGSGLAQKSVKQIQAHSIINQERISKFAEKNNSKDICIVWGYNKKLFQKEQVVSPPSLESSRASHIFSQEDQTKNLQRVNNSTISNSQSKINIQPQPKIGQLQDIQDQKLQVSEHKQPPTFTKNFSSHLNSTLYAILNSVSPGIWKQSQSDQTVSLEEYYKHEVLKSQKFYQTIKPMEKKDRQNCFMYFIDHFISRNNKINSLFQFQLQSDKQKAPVQLTIMELKSIEWNSNYNKKLRFYDLLTKYLSNFNEKHQTKINRLGRFLLIRLSQAKDLLEVNLDLHRNFFLDQQYLANVHDIYMLELASVVHKNQGYDSRASNCTFKMQFMNLIIYLYKQAFY